MQPILYMHAKRPFFVCVWQGGAGGKVTDILGKKSDPGHEGKKKPTKKSQDKAADLTPLAERS